MLIRRHDVCGNGLWIWMRKGRWIFYKRGSNIVRKYDP